MWFDLQDHVLVNTQLRCVGSNGSGVFQKASAIGRKVPLATLRNPQSNPTTVSLRNPSDCPVAKESATAKIGRAFNLRPPFVRLIDLLVYRSGLDMDVRAISSPK
ncbi:uncharacterized protein N7500_008118 [Penicillium coprophilum]|uniref:uncharacterized protein n=1 Tax=Penicillium coprophilum TaxID=36646 RepID=UPI0023999FE4|nr:uncharacterized protein N7500_008118 [Penicillium coprophilum]KAJ5158467.1 hypothetical protein N7500_008118 [Penicillium coprophilum]